MGSIRVTNLGKAYRQYPTRWSRLFEWLNPFSRIYHNLNWILRDINFHINPGEAVGIIGVNGAGKSTLLKLITGTIQPTNGSVDISGRVVALLELGMGFHPDFTGRQNVFMSGQLIGLGADKVASLMSEIEIFAEIGAYIDQPIRTYSSGMQVRLAFSVATAVRPDILIVDEALAVGDVYFQQKCFERINNFISNGTTLLFVSHSTGTVLNICSRVILIRSGMIAYDGFPKEAIDLYQNDLLCSLNSKQVDINYEQPLKPILGDEFNLNILTPPRLSGTGNLQTDSVNCIGVRFFDYKGMESSTLLSDTEITLEATFYVSRLLEDPHPGFKIRDRFGVVMFETNTYCMGQTIGSIMPNSNLVVRFTFNLRLTPEDYFIVLGFANDGFGDGSFKQYLLYLNDVIVLKVLPNPDSIVWAGLTNLNPIIKFQKLL